MDTTMESLNSFTKVTPDKAQALIDEGKGAIIFIGFAECPYCQRLVPKLKQVADEYDLTVYFVHSRCEDTLESVKALRDKYDAKTVPTLIYSNEGDVFVRSDSSMTVEEIASFVQTN